MVGLASSRSRCRRSSSRRRASSDVKASLRCHHQAVARATVLVGAALGVLVSISSVGAGAVGVTALLLLYPRLPMARIVGSDIAHAVPLTLIAGAGHWAMGAIDWHLMGVLLIGSLPGIVIGSYFATRVPETALRFLLATTLILVAGKLASSEWSTAVSIVGAVAQSTGR